jgi:dethiobiotin synthetase
VPSKGSKGADTASRAATRLKGAQQAPKPFRVFVTATDTGVGKTEVSAALLSLLADAGQEPIPFKPYESGVAPSSEPADARALLTASRSKRTLDQVCLHRYIEPLAPGVAAERGERDSGHTWRDTLRALKTMEGRALVVEGAGGLLVPLDAKHDVIDLIEAAKLPVVLVARAGLGTLNHTGLSIEALKARGLKVLAVVMVKGEKGRADPSQLDNALWIAARHGVQVLGPVPYRANARARRQAFRGVLAPLIQG